MTLRMKIEMVLLSQWSCGDDDVRDMFVLTSSGDATARCMTSDLDAAVCSSCCLVPEVVIDLLFEGNWKNFRWESSIGRK